MHLIAVWFLDLNTWWVILQVAMGLGFVIFVHELGHFAVAKWCGVKCEKFYLGFDIYGIKLFKYQYGETEYGIGLLPLGGYVKMLGQDDNPSHQKLEIERSRMESIPGGAPAPEPVPGESGMYDPRSYMAQSVPKRMAIISAGVIMNVIFAFFMAIVAYLVGVKEPTCAISRTLVGEPAWRAGLQPGDEIIQINDSTPGEQVLFDDLMKAVALGDLSTGVKFKIKRDGVAEPFDVTIKPDDRAVQDRIAPTIGVQSPSTNKLDANDPAISHTPAAKAGKFQGNDTIVAIQGHEVKNYAQYEREITEHTGEPLTITVEREVGKGKDAKTERVDIAVEPRPMKVLGLEMKMGLVSAVQQGSPAAEAGIKAGDTIELVDGKTPGDPLQLPEQMRRRAGETVTLTIVRNEGSKQEKLELPIKLRPTVAWEPTLAPNGSVSIPALGLAYRLQNTVGGVVAGSPAAQATLKPGEKKELADRFAAGDEIAQIEFITTPEMVEAMKKDKRRGLPKVELGKDKANWPMVMSALQNIWPGTKVKITLVDGRTAELEPVSAADWFYPEPGLALQPWLVTVKADSLSQAFAMGGEKTKESLLLVYSFLQKIGSQISVLGMGGPGTIATAAGGAASQGFGNLLLFLTMLSANLAVINFLPIPVLDGGHMVFLAMEGIRGKPVSQHVVEKFHYAGLAFLMSLMLFVISLDVLRISGLM